MVRFITIMILFSTLMWGQVQNIDKPSKGMWDFQAKKKWVVKEYGDSPLAAIQNIVIGEDGRIYVVDSQLEKIFILDQNGKTIKSFGKKGEGPGEIRTFRSGQHLYLLDNHLVYRDSGRIHYFSTDGNYLRSAPFSTTLRPSVFVSLDAFISAPSRITDEKKKTSPIKWVDIKENSQKIIAEYKPFAKATDRQESGGQQMSVTIVIGGVTPLMTVYYRNQKVYYGMSDSYRISISDLDGNSKGSFSVEGRMPQKLNEKFFSDLKASLGDIPADMTKRILDSLPRRAAFFQSIYVDKNELIYIVRSNPNEQQLIRMDIFSPEGKYLYQAALEIDKSFSINNMSFDNKFMVLDYQDDEGELYLAKYVIKLPEK